MWGSRGRVVAEVVLFMLCTVMPNESIGSSRPTVARKVSASAGTIALERGISRGEATGSRDGAAGAGQGDAPAIVADSGGKKVVEPSALSRFTRLFFTKGASGVGSSLKRTVEADPPRARGAVVSDEAVSSRSTNSSASHRSGLPSSSSSSGKPLKKSSSKLCHSDGCGTHASYGEPQRQSKSPVFCAKHRFPGLEDVRNRRCMHPEGCPRRATHGTRRLHRGCKKEDADDPQGDAAVQAQSVFCSRHRRPADPHLFRRTCQGPHCSRIPIFADMGSSRGEFCWTHRTEGQVDVVNRRCQHSPECFRRACYGVEGGKAMACRQHRASHYCDLVHSKKPVQLEKAGASSHHHEPPMQLM